MPKRRSQLHEYELFIERAIENYKESVPRSELLIIGDQAVRSLSADSQFALTELLLCDEVDRIVFSRLKLPSYRQWRSTNGLVLAPVPVLVDASGFAIASGDAAAVPIISFADSVSEELLAALAARPDDLHRLSPRRFEELIAELLNRAGLHVTLTPTTRDGGRDIVAKVDSLIGSFLCYVECKRYSPERPVGVRPVRELYGVVTNERVTQGVLVTTSSYSRAALAFRDQVPHQLSLKGYGDIVEWLTTRQARIGDKA